VARGEGRLRRPAWPNVLLIGAGVGGLVASFLLVLSFIRSYVEPPKIVPARPMLASAESTPVEITGFSGLELSPIDVARALARESLTIALVQGATASPPVDEASAATEAVPLPPRRPRPQTMSQLSGAIPVPRPRPQD
jgi:hypothetical protein